MNRAKIQFRPLDGLLLLDKPTGMSSNSALQVARRLLRAEKGGHTGSLDPLATGLLPLCLGEATKIAGLLLGSDKAYAAGVRLGVRTDTDDADGEAVETRPVPALDRARIEAALLPLLGRILQRPPVYSALKRDGEALYAKARRGETVEVEPREVDVRRIDLLAHDGADLQLAIECGTGTYVRSLVRDLGEALGCGAHVTSLRRLWVAPFRSPAMVTLDQLAAMDEPQREACLLPIEAGLADWPRLVLDAEQARRLGQGQRFAVEAATGRYLAVMADDGVALGMVEVDSDGLVRVQRLFRHAAF